MATVDDKKLAVDSNSDALTDYYNADVISAQDYSSFGATLVGRVDSSFKYRYSMNGQEKSDEVEPNTTTAEYWEYDSRLGRRWNLDPVVNEALSPYATFDNSPILLSDMNGDDPDGDDPGDGDGYTTTTQTSTINGSPGTIPGSMTTTIQSPTQVTSSESVSSTSSSSSSSPWFVSPRTIRLDQYYFVSLLNEN